MTWPECIAFVAACGVLVGLLLAGSWDGRLPGVRPPSDESGPRIQPAVHPAWKVTTKKTTKRPDRPRDRPQDDAAGEG